MIVRGLVMITVLTVVLAGALVSIRHATRERAEENRAKAEWALARQLTGVTDLRGPWQGDTVVLTYSRTLYRSRVRGYGGDIHFIAVFDDDELVGVRVTRHTETPGIADFLNSQLDTVDTVTGATITSRALIRGLNALAEKEQP